MLPAAERALAALPRKFGNQIVKRVRALAANPRPPGCKAMQGPWEGHLRIRSGNYRVIYRIADDRLIITVVKVGDRKEIHD